MPKIKKTEWKKKKTTGKTLKELPVVSADTHTHADLLGYAIARA